MMCLIKAIGALSLFWMHVQNYIQECRLDEEKMHCICEQLRKIKIRKQYKPSLIYHPKKRQYTRSKNRSGLKATFNDIKIKQWIQEQLPDNIELHENDHIDIVHYHQGQFFHEHTDFVNTFPHHAIQVSILVGLKTTTHGGTTIRVNDKRITYHTTIQKGGVLLFNSMLPHSGEHVVGEKEILVLTGYVYPHRISPAHWCATYCDKVECFAVHQDYYDLYSEQQDALSTVFPIYYLYQNDYCIGIYNSKTNQCYRLDQPYSIDCMKKEQLSVMKHYKRWSSLARSNYPILKSMLLKKPLDAYRCQCTSNQQHHETIYRYEKEYCNAGNDYDVLKIPDMYINIHCSWFSMAIYNANYYEYWIRRITKQHCPKQIVCYIQQFLNV